MLFPKNERKTGLGPATPTLARLCSTNWAISAGRFVGRQGVCCQTRCKSTIFSRNSKHSVAFFATSFHFWRLCLKALSEFWACWFLRDALFEVEAGAWRVVWLTWLTKGRATQTKTTKTHARSLGCSLFLIPYSLLFTPPYSSLFLLILLIPPYFSFFLPPSSFS